VIGCSSFQVLTTPLSSISIIVVVVSQPTNSVFAIPDFSLTTATQHQEF
jgi:hypothetical protein